MKITPSGGGSALRLVLIGMITHREVLSTLADKWESPGPFGEKWSNLIGQWCVSHYLKYGKPPGKAIETLFEKWAAKHKNAATVELVSSFLGKLSEKYATRKKEVNPDHVLDLAKELFTEAKAKQLQEDIAADLAAGEPQKAVARIDAFRPPNLGGGEIIDLLGDEKGMIRDLSDPKADVLIEYPGPLGKFFDDTFSIGNFVVFAGPEKSSKSWRLLDVVMRGAEQGRNVLYLQIGDMTRKQIRRRFAMRVAKRPFKPGIVRIPTTLDTVGEEVQVGFDEKTYEKYMDPERAWRCVQKMVQRGTSSDRIKLSVHPNKSLSVAGIKAIIDSLVRSGWVPSIIVIDYMDLLAAPPGFQGESRDAINENWATMRGIAHTYCVVSGTQVKRTAYNAEVIDKDDTADDKRKLAHVTAMYGINVKDEEKKQGVCRLNHIVLREGQFVTTDVVYCAGSLSMANPCILSSF